MRSGSPALLLGCSADAKSVLIGPFCARCFHTPRVFSIGLLFKTIEIYQISIFHSEKSFYLWFAVNDGVHTNFGFKS